MTKEQLLEQAKPILFNTEMVRALLDNRKKATRRVVKFVGTKNPNWTGYIKDGLVLYNGNNEPCNRKSQYQPGDILYVRETYCPNYFKEETQYGNRHGYKADYEQAIKSTYLPRLKWVPSIHMPKKAARIFLKVTDVRIERLQDIRADQAIDEGIPISKFDLPNTGVILRFSRLWNSTIQKAEQSSYSWEANPWVWVIEFERVIPED